MFNYSMLAWMRRNGGMIIYAFYIYAMEVQQTFMILILKNERFMNQVWN